jgi:hypothetical protein
MPLLLMLLNNHMSFAAWVMQELPLDATAAQLSHKQQEQEGPDSSTDASMQHATTEAINLGL